MAARKTTNAVATTNNDIEVRPLGLDTRLGVMAAKAAVASGTAARNFTGAFGIAFEGERRLAEKKRGADLEAIRARYDL